jgi:putative membrane-bound dehydrogenase-like protein
VEFWYNAIGLSLLFLGPVFALLGIYKIVQQTRAELISGLILLVTTLAGVGTFIYLTASTPVRRAYINLPMRELATDMIQIVSGLILAVIVLVAILGLAQYLKKDSIFGFGLVASFGIASYTAVVVIGLYWLTFTPDLDQVAIEAPEVETITVADNIPIQVFENSITQQPTALELGPNNELYVASIQGFIWVMQDENIDGVADQVTEFTSGLKQPEGLAWSEKGLYVTVIDKLLLLKDTNGDYKADESQVIVDGFPGEEYAFHQSNGLTFGPDGRIYIGVGATTDHRVETHPLAARILSVNPDGSDLQVYATGLRNPFGIIPAPGGGFFAIDNGSSGCIDTEHKIDDCSNKIDVPEEVNYITQGKDYGFPHYFGIPPQDSGTMPPVVTFPDHSAPTGIVIYEGDKFPEKYKGQLFVSLWARGEIYSVRLFRVDEEYYLGSSRLFVSGLIGPSAMINAPTGGLYVSSFTTNTIYHIGRVDRTSALATQRGFPESQADNSKVEQILVGDAVTGQQLFASSCAACHGQSGEGIAGLGKDMMSSEFVASKSDSDLVDFIKAGRSPDDPLNTTGMSMPQKGGNPALSDQDLYNIVAYIRLIQK